MLIFHRYGNVCERGWFDVNQPDEDKPKTVDPDKKSIVVKISNQDRIIIANRDVDRRSVRANVERCIENPEAQSLFRLILSPYGCDDSYHGLGGRRANVASAPTKVCSRFVS